MSKNNTVLIIDDDETILDSCTQVFEKQGYQTVTARNGEAGLQTFKKANPDLVLVDLKMPGIDGMEVLQKLGKIDPDCVAIVITGYGTIESAVEAMKRGAYDFLPKPFTPDELRIIVRRGLERRQSIRETKTLRNEKEKMRKNFISMVSHELRSPLAAVQQNLMVITGGMAGEISANTQQMLLRMKERIKGLIGLINDWLDMSRIESGEMITHVESVDLNSVLTDVVELLKPLADEKNVTLQLTLPDHFPSISGNPETLRMLFTNLINNGIKYNREGGTVETIVEEEQPGVKIIVKDTGIGIPQDKLPLIFEQFYRVKGKDNVIGSGLGLSIVQKIVAAHGGTIQVESELEKGTTFTVYLPHGKDMEPQSKKEKQQAHENTGPELR